jgi:hypothetical protein
MSRYVPLRKGTQQCGIVVAQRHVVRREGFSQDVGLRRLVYIYGQLKYRSQGCGANQSKVVFYRLCRVRKTLISLQ